MPILKSSLLKALIALVFGIVFNQYCNSYLSATFIKNALFISFAGLFIFFFINTKVKYKIVRYTYALFFLSFFFLAPITVLYFNNSVNSDNYFRKINNEKVNTIVGEIESISYKHERIKKIIINSKSILLKNKSCKTATGKILLNCDSAFMLSFSKGDIIAVNAIFTSIPKEIFPNNFDKKQYYVYQNIYDEARVKSSQIKLVVASSQKGIYAMSENFKLSLLNINRLYLKDESRNIADALLLGFDDEINNDVLQDYSKTGVIHILSVSGLHVALIYTSLLYLLNFFKRIPKFNIIKLIVCVSLIWFYAMVTGLSPSVTRSAIMISMVIIADTFGRKKLSYYAVISAAFLMLIYNPNYLFDIGFQFSFTALFGILIFHSNIYNLWNPKNYILDQTWQLVSVSLAAQVLTFPIAIYYFHQFPNYFLPANLIAIPLTTVIMYACIALIVFAKIKIVAYYIALLVSYTIEFLNYLIHLLANLPGALLDNIQIDKVYLFLTLAIICCMSVMLINRRFQYIYYSLILMAFLLVYDITKTQLQMQRDEIELITLKSNQLIFDIKKGNTAYVESDKPINSFTWKKLIAYHQSIGINKTLLFSDTSKLSTVFQNNNIINYENKKLAFLNKSNQQKVPERNIDIDFLFLSSRVKHLDEHYRAKKIIVLNKKWRNSYDEIKEHFSDASITYVDENCIYKVYSK